MKRIRASGLTRLLPSLFTLRSGHSSLESCTTIRDEALCSIEAPGSPNGEAPSVLAEGEEFVQAIL